MLILFHSNIWLNLSKVKKWDFETHCHMHLIRAIPKKKNIQELESTLFQKLKNRINLNGN